MNRNIEIKVRFTREELQHLNKKVKKTGMSREGYLRTLCNDKIPIEIPPVDYYSLIREVRALGNSINQIAAKAHSLGFIDTPLYRKHADEIISIADKMAAITKPITSEV